MKLFEFNGIKKIPKAPWSKYYKEGAMELNSPNCSVYNYFENKIQGLEENICLDYYGNKVKYKDLLKKVDGCAQSLYNSGVRVGDVVTICLSNTLEGIIAFLAINKIGAIANFIHPLSSENEIKHSLNETKSKILIILDFNYINIKNIIDKTSVTRVVLVNLCAYMPFFVGLSHSFKEKIKIKISKKNSLYIWWDDFISKFEKNKDRSYIHAGIKNNPAIILHSGGTTGTPKGVVLSNNNLISYIESAIIAQDYLGKGDTILALMPIFHGFGLVYSILFPLCIGMHVVLRPRFEVKDYCKMITKYKPQVLTGVPTLFESHLNSWDNPNTNLNFLKCALVGGDSLKPALRNRINNFFKEHGSSIKVIEGYGLSEAVCGVVQGIKEIEKPNTTGIPIPGTYVGIFSSEDKELPYGDEGEICVCGPTVMLGYYNNPEETKLALHTHEDGNIWLHTGDLGSMDKDGFVTYTSRLKRMIISSGYNVYPNQIEKILETHPAVKLCTVVGIPHKYKIEVAKAYIVLNDEYQKNDFLIIEFKKLCIKNLPKYSWPYKYEFIDELPKTRVGKIDFKKLQTDNEKEGS